MKLAPSTIHRASAAVLLTAALGATGCSAINYQATTHEYSGSDGVMADAEDVTLRHFLFVANEEGGPARLVGKVNNGSNGEAEVDLTVDGQTFTVELGPNEASNLENDEEFIVPSISAAPGGLQEVSVSGEITFDDGTTETFEESFEATINDGGMAEYRDLLPEGYDQSMDDHLEHGPDTWGGGAAHYDPEDEGH